MKGLVLAAGKGTRIAELSLVHKSFATVGDKKLIEYSMDLLRGEEKEPLVDEIVLVVGYHAEEIIKFVGDHYKGIKVSYAFQNEQKGIAHAVMTAAKALNDDFVLCLADEILLFPKMKEMKEYFYHAKADIVCGAVTDEEDLSMKPIAYHVDDDGNICSVTEKPSKYDNAYRGIGECIFSREMLSYLDTLHPNAKRGEYEMGDWIQLAVNDRKRVKIFNLADGYINVNFAEDLERASKIV